MITLPEGYAIHKRDKVRLVGGSWHVRVMRYDKNMDTYEAFRMIKKTEDTRVIYKAALLDGDWIEFDTEEELCIAMCAKHRITMR